MAFQNFIYLYWYYKECLAINVSHYPNSMISCIAITVTNYILWIEFLNWHFINNYFICINLPITSKQIASLIEFVTLNPMVPIDISMTKLQKVKDVYKHSLFLSISSVHSMLQLAPALMFKLSFLKLQNLYWLVFESRELMRKLVGSIRHLEVHITVVVWLLHFSSSWMS